MPGLLNATDHLPRDIQAVGFRASFTLTEVSNVKMPLSRPSLDS